MGFSGSGGSAGWLPTPPPAPVNPGAQGLFEGGLTAPGTGAGPASLDALGKFAKDGQPTDVSKLFESIMQANKRGVAESRSNLLENFGSQGLGHSSVAGTAMADFESQNNNNLNSLFQNLLSQSSESAKNRQLQASQFGTATFADFATSMYPTVTPYTIGGTGGWGPSAIQGGSQIASTLLILSALSGCWIAASLYGLSTPQFFAARRFIFTKWKGTGARLTQQLYLRFGRRIARSELFCHLLKPLFDLAVRRNYA